MCYNNKCMFCIRVETGSLIFAIFNVIVYGLSILIIIGTLVYINVNLRTLNQEESSDGEHMVYFAASLMTNVPLGIALCIILIPFAFTIVLIKGLVEKKAGLVKVYFIFYVVSTIGMILGWLSGLASNPYSVVLIILIISGITINGLIMRMIYMTYKKLEVDARYKQTRPIGQ